MDFYFDIQYDPSTNSLHVLLYQAPDFTPTPHTSVMTPSTRAFHVRHIEEDHDVSEGSEYSLDSDGHGHSAEGHDMPGEEEYVPPILEEDAFAHLVDSHFGAHDPTSEGCTDWDDLEKEARTPLFEGATSSR